MAKSAFVLLASCACAHAFTVPEVAAPRRGVPSAATVQSRRTLLQKGAVAAATLALGGQSAQAAEAFTNMGGLLEPFIDTGRGFKFYKPSGWTQAREPTAWESFARAYRRAWAQAARPSVARLGRATEPGPPASQFDADPGVYDVKFQDIIQPFETVQVAWAPQRARRPRRAPPLLFSSCARRTARPAHLPHSLPSPPAQMATSPVSTATSVSALGDLQAVGEKFAKSREAKLLSAKESDVEGSLVYTLELEGELYHELIALCINRGKLYKLTCVATNKRWSKRGELYKNLAASFVPKGF